ncbi:MAG: chemotaxis protein CheW [Bdellovibrionota bacterium]
MPSFEKKQTEIFASFLLDKTEFAICVDYVQEVVNYSQNISVLPMGSEFVEGVLNLRGMAIPIFNLRKFLKMEGIIDPAMMKVAVVKFNSIRVGLVFDSACEIIHPKAEERSYYQYNSGSDNKIISGAIKIETSQRLLQILDPQALLALQNIPHLSNDDDKVDELTIKRSKVSTLKKCITFTCSGIRLGFEITGIHEILTVPEIQKNPWVSDLCMGMTKVRGKVIPVLKFSQLFKRPESDGDPLKHYFMTRGADYPGEKILHDEIELYNREAQLKGQPQFRIVALWPAENKGIVYPIGKTTDAVVASPWWYELSAVAVNFIKRQNGLMVFVGGGDILNSEIQAAKNAGIKFLVAKGPEGAANEAAKLYPERAFSNSNEFLEKLRTQNPEFLNDRARALRPGQKLWTHQRQIHWTEADAAIQIIQKKYKRIVTFGGNSTQGFADEKAVEQAVKLELKKYNPNEVVINGPGSEVGIGLVYRVAKQLGFRTIGIISEKTGEPAKMSVSVDEVFVIKDHTWGGVDPETKTLSATTRTLLTVSEAYLAFAGGVITASEYEQARIMKKRTAFYRFEKNRSLALQHFVRDTRSKILNSLQGKVRAYADVLVDIALLSVARAAYDGRPMDAAMIEEAVQAINARAKGYDFDDSIALSRSIMDQAMNLYRDLKDEARFNYFNRFGTADARIRGRQNSGAGQLCRAVFMK